MQDPIMPWPSEPERRSTKPCTAPNSNSPPVLKCPRCDSMNTKFCYYNNYSLTQPRHFCKNCRRYWTQGGTLRNVPVGGGCRRNKRVKHRPFSVEPTALVNQDGLFISPTAPSFLHNPSAELIPTPEFADQHPGVLSISPSSSIHSHVLNIAFARLHDSLLEQQQQQTPNYASLGTHSPSSALLTYMNNIQQQHQQNDLLLYSKSDNTSQLLYSGSELALPMYDISPHVGQRSATATLWSIEDHLATFGSNHMETHLATHEPAVFMHDKELGLQLRSNAGLLEEHTMAAGDHQAAVHSAEVEKWETPHIAHNTLIFEAAASAEPQSPAEMKFLNI